MYTVRATWERQVLCFEIWNTETKEASEAVKGATLHVKGIYIYKLE